MTTAVGAAPTAARELLDAAAAGIFDAGIPDRRDGPATMLKLSRGGGALVPVRRGDALGVLLTAPELIEHVLVGNAANYTHPPHPFRELEGQYALPGAVMLRLTREPGSGIVAADESARVFGEEAERTAEALLNAPEGGAVDAALEAKRLVFRATVRLLYGVDAAHLDAAFVRAFGFLEECWKNWPFGGPRPRPDPEWGLYLNALEVRDRTAAWIVREAGLVPAEGSGPAQLRHAVIDTVFNATGGSSVTLAWTLQQLALHPEARARVEREVDEVLPAVPGAADFRRLAYTRLAVMETLRLYPPAWAISRKPLADDRIGEHRVPAGTDVTISPFALHRDPALWERPLEWNPDRFAPGRSAGRHRLAYLPFGAGERQCPAGHLVVGHMQVILGTLFRRCRLEGLEGAPARPRGLVSLRPSPGVWARFSAR